VNIVDQTAGARPVGGDAGSLPILEKYFHIFIASRDERNKWNVIACGRGRSSCSR